MPNTDEAVARQVMDAVDATLEQSGEGGAVCSVSMGLAIRSDVSGTLADAYHLAEEDMHRHKVADGASMRSKTIDIIMRALYEKSQREEAHSKRVGALAGDLAAKLGMGRDMVNQIRTAGMIHDIGKIGIDEKVLNKPGRLDELEWQEMQRHPEIGFRILSSSGEFNEIASYVLDHHERLDGSGYPRGLSRAEIGVPARILNIVDSYDAMTSERPYKKPMTRSEAAIEIKRCAGTQFDTDISRVFVEKILHEPW
jgi:putative nucleotidyltransferase with HDIG domain